MLGFSAEHSQNSFDSCISISHFDKISSKCTNPYFSKPTNPDFLSRHHNLTANLFYWIITRQNYKYNFEISNICTILFVLNKKQCKIKQCLLLAEIPPPYLWSISLPWNPLLISLNNGNYQCCAPPSCVSLGVYCSCNRIVTRAPCNQ